MSINTNGNISVKRKMPRFGALDAAIIIALIVCGIGIFMRFDFAEKLRGVSENTEAEISFLIQDIAPSSLDAIKVGDTVYCDGETFGVIKSLEEYNAEAFLEDESGTLIKSENTSRRDVRGVITISGVNTADGFMLSGTSYIAAGKSLSVYTSGFRGIILVTGLKTIG